MDNTIMKTQKFLFDYLYGSENEIHVIDYIYEHSLRVSNLSLIISEKENANKKVAAIASLLHDLGKFDTDINIEHGRVSAGIARAFLETLELTEKEVNDICYAIAIHVDGKCGYEYEKTLEGMVVTDSDHIDRFSSMKISHGKLLESKVVYKSIKEKIYDVEQTLAKLNNYMNSEILETISGNIIFKEKVNMQIGFYNERLKELKHTNTPIIKK